MFWPLHGTRILYVYSTGVGCTKAVELKRRISRKYRSSLYIHELTTKQTYSDLNRTIVFATTYLVHKI